jgi:hypothetical protein
MAVSANFVPSTGVLTTTGDDLDNTMTTSRNAAGSILVNGGAVAIVGGTPTVANTTLISSWTATTRSRSTRRTARCPRLRCSAATVTTS